MQTNAVQCGPTMLRHTYHCDLHQCTGTTWLAVNVKCAVIYNPWPSILEQQVILQHSLPLALSAAQGMGEALTQLLNDWWLLWGLAIWLCLALAPLQGVQVISCTKPKRLQASLALSGFNEIALAACTERTKLS